MTKGRTVYFSLIMGVFLFGCTNEDNIGISETKIQFTSFVFEKRNNPSLDGDVVLSLERTDTLFAFIPELETNSSLVPTFEVGGAKVYVEGKEQVSGVTTQNFESLVKYLLIDDSGRTDSCFVEVLVKNALPVLRIDTENNAPIESQTEYVKASFSLTNCPESGALYSDGKIRGRGNATWGHPKKPYKIKFSTKQSPCGFPANKDWVILAEYCDKSLMRTAYMCEVSKAVGLKYTVNYQPIEVYLNGEYEGVYILADQIEKAKQRVNIESDGFLIEDDSYYEREPLYFISDYIKEEFTFKYPDAGDGKIKKGMKNMSISEIISINLKHPC